MFVTTFSTTSHYSYFTDEEVEREANLFAHGQYVTKLENKWEVVRP